MPTLELVSATRVGREQFLTSTALGLSLKRTGWDRRIRNHVFFNNTQPLPEVYNRIIDQCPADSLLLFVHDDVWLDDFNLFDRVSDGLAQFDVIGVAGNRRVPDRHCGWAFVDDALTWDSPEYLSGRVSHGQNASGLVSVFGDVPSRCQLLDGVFLAARAESLKRTRARFDPQFAFHFYDLDFCRTATKVGLTLGTWPISITHQSGGSFGSDAWKHLLRSYRAKWSANIAAQ